MTKCTYKDLTVQGTSNQTYTVGEDFETDELIEDTGLENIESVDCDNCGEWFNSLAAAKEHIEEQEDSTDSTQSQGDASPASDQSIDKGKNNVTE